MNTPTIRKVIATTRLLVRLNRRQVSARRGVIISGASGTGKTTAPTQLGRAHELAVRRRNLRDRNRLPVISPGSSTRASPYTRCAAACTTPTRASCAAGTASSRTSRPGA
ncbi:hypothetical protein RMN57_33660 [Kitasatospora sp. CM 4170]|uniref:hypothetical protein n=1 Tax=Kitasatospora TaxID=2063 RepID=UPI0028AEE6D5|nr:hypothetical protein [Kitasatospora sp. CM 4170]WNM50339.1 hypothetical protein RMN57_33660 [Kitasatospora sp. CM 4170]